MSTATTGMPGGLDGDEHQRRRPGQRAGARDSDDAVDHRSVPRGSPFTTRPPARRNAAKAAGCVIGIEQNRRRRRTAAPEERRGPQRVTPLSPEPTTAQTPRPVTPPVRRRNWRRSPSPARWRHGASALRRAGLPAGRLGARICSGGEVVPHHCEDGMPAQRPKGRIVTRR